MKRRKKSSKAKYGYLMLARTGQEIRPATHAELAASKRAARYDGGSGIIMHGSQPAYVSGE